MILLTDLVDERFVRTWITQAETPLFFQEHSVSLVSRHIGKMDSAILIDIGVDVRPGVYSGEKDDREKKD